MDIINLTKEAFFKRISGINLTPGELVLNIIICLLIILIGIFLGKIIKLGLRRLIEKSKLEKIINPSFINLFLVIIKWSVYIMFINFALLQLEMPIFTGWLTTILSVIPSLTGALIIIASGFGIATYLKKTIENSRVEGWEILSMIFFYFINFVFIIFGFKTALISIRDNFLINMLLGIFTLLAGFALILYGLKHKKFG